MVGYISRAERIQTRDPGKTWVTTSPTKPGDIGAETPQGAQDKANKVKDDVANGRISIPADSLKGIMDVARTKIRQGSNIMYWIRWPRHGQSEEC
ncbi:hypothetical protein P7H15_26080 [Paenibacillus larvae]|nr:hypothetical protein [Paenibacillus larvae]MDT2295592.1 hypothetical protein [Paenibacillus larvae]